MVLEKWSGAVKLEVNRNQDAIVLSFKKEKSSFAEPLFGENPDDFILTEPEDLLGHNRDQLRHIYLTKQTAIKLARLLIDRAEEFASGKH